MIRIEVLTGNNSHFGAISLEEISDVISDPDNLIWIDLEDPTPHDFQLIAEEFAFHPLAIEDARKQHQRPKLDQYDTFLFIVFYAVHPDGGESAFSTQEITVKPGDTVVFANDDDVAHNVFCNNPDCKFNTKIQNPGVKSPVKFDKEGTYEVRCAIHPKMKLTVTVKK